MCALYNLCQTFLLLLQKFQKIDEEHLKVIIGYLEKYIDSQKKGQVLVVCLVRGNYFCFIFHFCVLVLRLSIIPQCTTSSV